MSVLNTYRPLTPLLPQDRVEVVSPIENDIIWEFRTTTFPLVPQPARLEISFPFNGTAPDGSTIQINDTLIFFRDTPTPGDAPATPGATPAEVAQGVFQILKSNPILNSNYTIFFQDLDILGANIIIVAKRPGSEFNLTFIDNGTSWIGSPINSQNSFYAEDFEKFSVFLDVYVYKDIANRNLFDPDFNNFDSTELEYIGRLRKDFTGDNIFSFNLKNTLGPYVETSPPSLDPLLSIFQPVPSYIRRYAVVMGEEYLDGNSFKETILFSYGFNPTNVAGLPRYEVSRYWVANSAVPLIKTPNAVFLDYQEYWNRDDNDFLKFLTKSPQEKRIDPRSIEYLYFFFDRSSDDHNRLEIELSVELENGIVISGITPPNTVRPFPSNTVSSGRYGSVISTEVSPRIFQNDFDTIVNNNGSRIKSYTVAVYEALNNGTDRNVITEPKTYELYYEDYEAPIGLQLLFQNSLGAFDTLFGFGEIEKEIKSKIEIHESTIIRENVSTSFGIPSLEYPNSKYLSQEQNFASDQEIFFTFSSGYYSLEHKEWLMELGGSTEFYMTFDKDPDLTAYLEASIWHKVIIEDYRYSYNDEGDMLAVELECRLGIPKNHVKK